MKRAHVRVQGSVQGVFFRVETRDRARSLGVSGWVRNQQDGAVEAVFEGPEDRVESMVEWCRSGSGCRAVAFERNEQRRKRIADNAAAFGVDIEVQADAPESFDFVPPPSAIFIGGGLTQPGLLDTCYERLPSGGRLVANAVTAESEAVLTQWHSRLGGELRRYQHYQGEPLGKFTGWRPAMPVTQWVVTKQ